LIDRTTNGLKELVPEHLSAKVSVESEETGVNLFLVVEK